MQNHDLRTLSVGKHLRAFGLAVLGALCAFQVSAAEPAPSAFNRFMWSAVGGTSESSQILSFSKTGSPVLNPVVPQIDTDGGMPRVQTQGQLKNPAGRVYDVGASGRIPASEVGKAVGRFAVRSAGALVVGVALYDLAKELLFIVSRNSDGSLKVEKDDQTVCTVAPCYAYDNQMFDSVYLPRTDLLDACLDGMGYNLYGSPVTTAYVSDALNYRCFFSSAGGGNSFQMARVQVAPSASVLMPATVEELTASVASKSGWPSNSAITKVLADPLASQDQEIEVGPLTVTGPATSPGTTTSTVNTTNNTTKTDVITYNHSYDGPKVNTSTTTVSTVIDNSTNQTISNEITTAEPVEPLKTEDPCLEHPDRNGCREDDFDVPEDEIPTVEKTISFSPENLGFAGGTCPANRTVDIHQAGITVIAGNWATACDYAVTYAKPMILALATFSALMIIFGFGKAES